MLGDDEEYRVARLREWTFSHHLSPGISDLRDTLQQLRDPLEAVLASSSEVMHSIAMTSSTVSWQNRTADVKDRLLRYAELGRRKSWIGF